MAGEREIVNVNEEAPSVETTDRGLFDFMKKSEVQKPHEEVQKPHEEEKFATEFEEKVQVSEPAQYEKEEVEETKHESLLQKLKRSDSSSSSSSDEEGLDEEEKRKRKEKKKEKKGLKEKIKEKLPGHKDEEDTNVPIEKYDDHKEKIHVEESVYSEPSHPAPPHHEDDHEKKGFLDKIKGKLPGQAAKKEEHHDSASPVVAEPGTVTEGEEKKGFLEKIKDKIPGFHSKNGEEKKEVEEKKESH